MSDAKTEERPETREKAKLRLGVMSFKAAEYEENVWIAMPAAGTAFDDILDPEYWAGVARNLRPWDIIKIRYDHDDAKYFAELIVEAVADTRARVTMLRKVNLRAIPQAEQIALPEGYEVHKRGNSGWTVMVGSEVIKAGFKTRDEAVLHARSHAKTFLT